MGNLGINIDEIAPVSMDFDPLPAGKYLAEIINSEVVPTKAGDGRILKLTFNVISGDYVGRKVFENLNIENKSEKAQQTALGMLSALCRAVGKSGIVNDSTELHERPLYIKVKIEEASGEYKAKNKITEYISSKAEAAKPAKKVQSDFDSDPLPF